MRVAVFIDWMNAYKAAREAFSLESEPGFRGQFDPYQAALVLAGANKRKDVKPELARVEIHRGQPTSTQSAIGSSAVDLHAQAWEASAPGIVKAQLRPLRQNPQTLRLEEKGVDVQLASCAVEWSFLEDIDVVIVFSHDTDLSAVVEVIARIKGPAKVETASWVNHETGFYKRIPPITGVTNHRLREKLFRSIEDRTNYGKAARTRVERRRPRS